MKKTIASLLCALLLVISILGFSCTQIAAQLKGEGGRILIQQQIDLRTPLDQAIRKLPGSLFYRGMILKKVDAMQEAFFAQEDVAAWLQKTAIHFTHCIAQPDQSLPVDLNEEFYALLSKHQDLLVEKLSLPLSHQEGDSLITLLCSFLNVRTVLAKQIHSSRNHMNSLQLFGLRFVDLCLTQNMHLLMLGIGILAFLGLLFLGRRKGWLLGGGVLIFMGSGLWAGYLLLTHMDILFLQADALPSLTQGVRNAAFVYIVLGGILIITGSGRLKKHNHKTKAMSS